MPWKILDNDAILTAIAALKTTSINNGGTVLPAATSIYDALTFQQQPDAVISQANPVSATPYTVLATTTNVRIISIEADITWAVTQPTAFQVIVTIDGQTIIFQEATPISGTFYLAAREEYQPANLQVIIPRVSANRPITPAFLLEGRSIQIQAQITWAVTQPSPLVCRVKWAKR